MARSASGETSRGGGMTSESIGVRGMFPGACGVAIETIEAGRDELVKKDEENEEKFEAARRLPLGRVSSPR